MTRKEAIERKLRRIEGPNSARRAEIAAQNAKEEWWVRCWNCRKTVSKIRTELEGSSCPHCGVNLWTR